MIRWIKLLRYSYRLRISCVMWIIFSLIGIAACIMDTMLSSVSAAGSTLLAIGGVFALQFWFTINAAGLVKSAPVRKAAHTTIPACLCVGFNMVSVVVILVIYLIRYFTASPEGRVACVNGLLWSSFTIILLMLYAAMAFKYFLLSFAFFLIFFMFLQSYGTIVLSNRETALVSLPVAVLANLLAVLVGGVFMYGVNRIFYRKDISKYALDSKLRKSMT